jgi:hypothetical protein
MPRSRTTWMGAIAGAVCCASLAAGQPDDCGAYLEFDGVDDVVVSYGDFNTEELTLETWVLVETSDPVYASGLVTWGTRTQGSYDLCVGPPDNLRLCFFINYNTGAQRTLHGTTLLTLGEWYHAAATYDGEVARLYLNGELDAEGVFGDPIVAAGEGARLSIGDDWAGASEFVHGAYDEVMVWGVARTAEQIVGDMGGSESAQDPAMLAHYTFDECRSNVVLDHSGQGRHAHLGASYDTGADDPRPQRWGAPAGRTRVQQLTSRMSGMVEAIGGPLETQLMCVNHCVVRSLWQPLLNRHEDLHVRAAFECSGSLEDPFVDTETFLTGADEVTRHNCESAFYRFEFFLPPVFEGGDFYGVMNADDMGVVHLNGGAISPTINQWDVDHLGAQRTDPFGHPVVAWPHATPVYALESGLLRPGMNELVVAVVSDVSEFEPAGTEFIFQVRYDCLGDWNADGESNSIDFLAFVNDWAADNAATDLNLDGEIDTLDVLVWMNTWTFGCPE